jgi:hypothetical protein
MKKLFLVIISTFIFLGCEKEEELHLPPNSSNSYEFVRHSDFNEGYGIYIVTVRNCEYVIYERGYGSDMEHYADCQNPNHIQNQMKTKKWSAENLDE